MGNFGKSQQSPPETINHPGERNRTCRASCMRALLHRGNVIHSRWCEVLWLSFLSICSDCHLMPGSYQELKGGEGTNVKKKATLSLSRRRQISFLQLKQRQLISTLPHPPFFLFRSRLLFAVGICSQRWLVLFMSFYCLPELQTWIVPPSFEEAAASQTASSWMEVLPTGIETARCREDGSDLTSWGLHCLALPGEEICNYSI